MKTTPRETHRRLVAFCFAGAIILSARAEDLVAQGKVLFMTKICFTCHQTNPAVPAPAGLALKAPAFMGDFWGKEREVHKGIGGPLEKVKMDEKYFVESIKKPMVRVLKGALTAMPPPPPVTDAEIKALLAYVKSLHQPAKKKN